MITNSDQGILLVADFGIAVTTGANAKYMEWGKCCH